MSVNVKQNGALTKVGGLYKESTPMSVAEYYSTDEHKVGVWVDGKPLYQKTIIKTDVNISANETYDVETLTGVDNVMVVHARMIEGGITYILNDTSSKRIKYTSSTGKLQISDIPSGASWVDIDLYITIQYTKTSDNATGGVYAPIIPMQMASKYSTDEKVVGQWVDGKPLYQKTLYFDGTVPKDTWTDHNISDVDKIWVYDAFGKRSSDYRYNGINYFGSDDYMAMAINRTQIYISYPTQTVMTNDYITVRYTKTTDTAGTGLYSDDEAKLAMLADVDISNPTEGDTLRYNSTSGKFENVAREVYSTDEQVIGKWADGSTLYRKVFTNTGSSVTCTSNTWINVSFATVTNLGRVIDAKVYDSNNTEFVGCIAKDNNMLAFYNIRNASVILDSGSQVIMTYTKATS